MKKLFKRVSLLSIIVGGITFLSLKLYNTYATDPIPQNDTYAFDLTGDTTVSVPANSYKDFIFQIKNTNGGTANYGVGYSSTTGDSIVGEWNDSTDPATGTIAQNNYKYVKIRVENNGNNPDTVTLSTILGYENGGELIVPNNVTAVTEKIYRVTFDPNGGDSTFYSKGVRVGATYGNLPSATRSGYTFLGWSTSSASRIPFEYQEVEWIEGKYGPAINTGINLTLETEIETEGMQGERENPYLSMYGCAQPYISISYANNSSVYSSFGNIYDSTGGSSNWYSDFNTFVQNKTGWFLNGILQKQYNATSVSVNESRKIAVFARYSSNNTIERASWWKIKYFIIRENGVEVSHLIPCYRKSDGEVGMYDTIQHVFRTNVGSSTFTSGNNIGAVVTSSSIVTNSNNHTLYAIWEDNS